MIAKITDTKERRKELAERSLAWFIVLYLSHYLKAATPDFHYKIFQSLEDDKINTLELIAFRGSAKSTIVSLAFPLWSAIFGKRNFIILCSDTHTQAKQIISNLIYEFEYNKFIMDDFGNFETQKEDWTATNIFLKNNVRIMSRSRGQKVRGLRHLQSRPDLIILDDVENIQDVRTKDQRDKTEEWALSDVIPSLDPVRGKIVVIGNFLHKDSFMMRLKNKILSSNFGTVEEFPLITNTGINLWPSAYSPDKIASLKAKSGLRYFQREYLLQIHAPEDQLVKRIPYYNEIPKLEQIALGVDLAISKKDTADYTSINIAGEAEGKIYNLKNISGRWDFNETLVKIKETFENYQKIYPDLAIGLYVESVAYQQAAIEEIQRRYSLPVTGVNQTRDKRARLETYLPYFENDQILFRREGMEDLIDQLLGFGHEKWDDIIDAAMLSWQGLLNREKPQILWL